MAGFTDFLAAIMLLFLFYSYRTSVMKNKPDDINRNESLLKNAFSPNEEREGKGIMIILYVLDRSRSINRMTRTTVSMPLNQ